MTHRPLAHRLGLAVAAMAVLVAAPALAHHSFNAYDMSKTLTMSGAIKAFRWGAPHSSVVLIDLDKSGKAPGAPSRPAGSPGK